MLAGHLQKRKHGCLTTFGNIGFGAIVMGVIHLAVVLPKKSLDIVELDDEQPAVETGRSCWLIARAVKAPRSRNVLKSIPTIPPTIAPFNDIRSRNMNPQRAQCIVIIFIVFVRIAKGTQFTKRY